MANRGGARSRKSRGHTLTSTSRHYFFDGVFENLSGMTYIPNREFLLLFCILVVTHLLVGPIETFKVMSQWLPLY